MSKAEETELGAWVKAQIRRGVTAVAIIPIEFEILDALFTEHITPVDGFVDLDRQDLSRGSALYNLSQRELGNVGSLKLVKVAKEDTMLQVIPPPLPKKASHPEGWRAPIRDFEPDTQEWRDAWHETLAIDDEVKKAERRRQTEHQAEVMKVLFSNLQQWPVWRAATVELQGLAITPGRPPDTEYDEAFQEIQEGRTYKEVRDEWIAKREVEKGSFFDAVAYDLLDI